MTTPTRDGLTLNAHAPKQLLLLALLLAVPAQAGIQYGRDDWSLATYMPDPICSKTSSLSCWPPSRRTVITTPLPMS